MDILEFFKNDRFAEAAGAELVEVGEGYAVATMEVGPQHLNAGGVCQGGALFTLADLACAGACNSHGRLTLLTNASVNFFKAVSSGLLRAEAREVYEHTRLCHYEVRVLDEAGELVALFNGNGYHKNAPLPF